MKQNKPSCFREAERQANFPAARYGSDLSDDGVVSRGDGVEDPLDALELLLVAGGDPVKSLVVVLQSTAALAAGNRKQAFVSSCKTLPRPKHGEKRLTCRWGRPPPCIASSSAGGSPSPPSPPNRSSPPQRSPWASAEPETTTTREVT